MTRASFPNAGPGDDACWLRSTAVTTVPAVRGKRPSEGFEVLERVGLKPVLLGVPTTKSDGNLGYRIAVQEPAADQEVPDGARVYLSLASQHLSLGNLLGPEVAAPGTAAPAVVGLDLEHAMSAITRRGLVAVVFQPDHAVTTLDVRRQDPPEGQPAPFREVAIWLD